MGYNQIYGKSPKLGSDLKNKRGNLPNGVNLENSRIFATNQRVWYFESVHNIYEYKEFLSLFNILSSPLEYHDLVVWIWK